MRSIFDDLLLIFFYHIQKPINNHKCFSVHSFWVDYYKYHNMRFYIADRESFIKPRKCCLLWDGDRERAKFPTLFQSNNPFWILINLSFDWWNTMFTYVYKIHNARIHVLFSLTRTNFDIIWNLFKLHFELIITYLKKWGYWKWFSNSWHRIIHFLF